VVLLLCLLGAGTAARAQEPAPSGEPPAAQVDGIPPVAPVLTLTLDGAGGPRSMDAALKIVLLMTVLSLAPAFLVLLTSFTRIVIVLGFLRQAIGANQAPNNQIIIGLALFLTLVVMSPTLLRMNDEAIQPFMNEQMSQAEAFAKVQIPLKEFMLGQVREKDVALFLDLTSVEAPEDPQDLPMLVVIPSFVLSELKTAFQMGFILFVPFLIIDMVVASVLMSMGMMMLPPVLISLPFKILLFVLVDGWFLVVKSLVQSFQ
jgi:flagellar biosynthetic protein FliP